MASESINIPFEELLLEPVRNGIYKEKEYHGRGAKIINMGELFAYPRLRDVPMKRVELNDSEANRFNVKKGDLLFARRSLVAEGAGKCSIVLELNEQTTFESSIIRARPDKSKADSLYLYYFFNSTAGLHSLDTIRRHVAVAGITGSDLSKLAIPIPPISEQHTIAHILGTLDDKIELNRKMNETLEAMARAIFKSWFVDFDPVRAKMEGRDTGLPKEIADLFPDSFEESELGGIPKGWQVTTIGEICRRIAMGPFGSDIKTDNFIESGVPVVRGSNLTKGFVENSFVFVSDAKADQLRNANAFPGDIIITHRGTLGQVGLIPARSLFPRYVVSQSQMLLSINTDIATSRYVYEFLCSNTGQHRLLANTSQTGVPAIARPTSSVKAIQIILPPIKVLRLFNKFTDQLYNRRDFSINESSTLTALRDVLLPKLISGEIRVKDAEKFIGVNS